MYKLFLVFCVIKSLPFCLSFLQLWGVHQSLPLLSPSYHYFPFNHSIFSFSSLWAEVLRQAYALLQSLRPAFHLPSPSFFMLLVGFENVGIYNPWWCYTRTANLSNQLHSWLSFAPNFPRVLLRSVRPHC